MSHRFASFGAPSEPATPDKPSRSAGKYHFGTEPTTTPAGPPPSASNSFTPAGAPSASYLGSSMMRGMTSSKQPQSTFSSGLGGGTGRNLFGRKETPPLPRAGRTAKGRGPSALSQSIRAESVEREAEPAPETRAGTFRLAFDDFSSDDDDDDDDEGSEDADDAGRTEEQPYERDQYQDHDSDADGDADGDADADADNEDDDEYRGFGITGNTAYDAEVEQFINREIDGDAESEEGVHGREEEEEDEDPFLDMDDSRDHYMAESDPDEDLMLLATPAADARARQEAENIFRASTLRRSLPGRRADFQFDSIAREHYAQHGRAAVIQETPNLILETEDLVSQLYDEGIGAKDDAEKLDSSLALAALQLTQIWNEYAQELPDPEDEHMAGIGPGLDDEPFRKAAFIADLVIRIHHTRLQDSLGEEKRPPLPEVLFQWMKEAHNPYPDQVDEVTHYNPNAICHTLFWQTVRTTLVRGDVGLASDLLASADFQYVRKNRGPPTYTGKALENIQYAVKQTCDMLDTCPGAHGDWNIWGSDWVLFRVKATASLAQLQRFAEGKDQQQFESSNGGYPGGSGQSLAGLARKAESRVPWEVYEQLNTIYDVVIGDHTAILETAQDWCEATIGLFGWWDEEKDRPKKRRLNLLGSTQLVGLEDHFDRLTRAIYTTVESDFHFDPRNAVEVALASAFEGNFAAVIGLLREWSLPVACATAEIGALGQWLPKPQPKALLPMDTLDDDDLDVLGVPKQGPDELQGIKDTTLVWYARELAGIDQLSTDREGWEVAVQVLGRMDSVEKSEETVGELLHDILETLQPDSSGTVDKMWRILTDLGMVNFAEETVETFADLLARDSHRYGEAIWYYALAHKPSKVREVLNLLTSYSLLQSTAFPSPSDLDDHLHRLLTDRSATLEDLAKRDLDAAQLVGRMLSGYATLRKFYEIRDGEGGASKKRQAAAALVAVVASSDDNIRGGLYDESRDAVVSEDFLLALLGEAMVLVGRDPPVLTVEQMEVLLKAIEDVETVGTRVFTSCEEFFKLVLASAQGLKGSTPSDLLQQSSAGGSGGLGGSFVMLSGSSMLASQLHKSIGPAAKITRGWDWRAGLRAGASAGDVLRVLRLGLSRELAGVWLREADNVAVF